MPLSPRHIGTSLAVAFFFGVSFIGWADNLAPFTCCKRALIAATVGYIAGSLAVRAVNAILISALVDRQLSRQRERNRDDAEQ